MPGGISGNPVNYSTVPSPLIFRPFGEANPRRRLSHQRRPACGLSTTQFPYGPGVRYLLFTGGTDFAFFDCDLVVQNRSTADNPPRCAVPVASMMFPPPKYNTPHAFRTANPTSPFFRKTSREHRPPCNSQPLLPARLKLCWTSVSHPFKPGLRIG
jgi:hypothetical protein